MLRLHRSRRHEVVLASLASIASLALSAAPANADIGYDDLVARLGGVGVPTGAGVNVVQAEAPVSPGNYGPDQSISDFIGITFTAMSGGSGGNSWHATTVAQNFYGEWNSIATGITGVWLYEAGNFVQSGYLRLGMGSASLPLMPPGASKVFNHSWIGSFGSTSLDNEANRRADFAQNRDFTLFCVGLNNGAGVPPSLMSHNYNGLSVGLEDGAHSWGVVPAGYDGAGRMKPEVVAPQSATSWATGIVSSVAALLYETAMTPPLNANPDSARGVVIKSCMMSGANHRDTWTNAPATSGPTRGVTAKPLDQVYGADRVDINRSHWVLTSGEQEGSTTVPSMPNISPRGWDFRSMAAGNAAYYRFKLTQPVEDVSILVAWNRNFGSTITAGIVANQTLTLWKVQQGSTTLETLVGDPGIPYFMNGNVVSQSAVDNVEHLYLHDLAAGEYVIQLQRVDGLTTSVQTAISWIMPETPACAFADFNCDGVVDGDDLGSLLGEWGDCPECIGDLNGDGMVDGDDLGALLGEWS